MDLKWEKKFDDLAQAKDERLGALEHASDELISWKPTVDAAMDGIKLKLKWLNKQWEQSILENAVVDPRLLVKPESVSARPSTGIPTDGPIGHREDLHHRDQGFRSMATFLPIGQA